MRGVLSDGSYAESVCGNSLIAQKVPACRGPEYEAVVILRRVEHAREHNLCDLFLLRT